MLTANFVDSSLPPLCRHIPHTSSEQAHWYAVRTRPRHEKKVTAEIEEKGICTFLPLLSQVRRWSDRRKTIQLPLFPGYTFLHSSLVPQVRTCVLRIWGVVGFVGQQNVGLAIPDCEIENVRLLLATRTALTPYPFLKTGQRVRVRGGALDGVEGILVTPGDRRVVISIESIHHSLSVNVEGYDIEPA